MSTSSLVLILVVVAVVLIAALVTGVVLTRRRRISLTQKEEGPKSGGYQASSGISLAPAIRAVRMKVVDALREV